MTVVMMRRTNGNHDPGAVAISMISSCLRQPLLSSTAILGFLTLLWLLLGSSGGGGDTTSQIKSSSSLKSRPIQKGTMPTSGVEYYQCLTVDEPSSSSIHLLLLHGSKFTKEDWKTSGILQQFCSIPGWTVTAFDLSVSADARVFQALLGEYQRTMRYRNQLSVVTPSASGRVITDWIMNGNVAELSSYLHTWIPVAAGSVHSLSEPQLQIIPPALDILAIYGDKDTKMGHDTSMKLQRWASATSVELKGSHPVYLDSPDEFVQVIRKHLSG
jgi:hypothetical protein